ncbi:MAG: hypothetical protein ACRDNM_04000 [Gaiellaceae bacterium]
MLKLSILAVVAVALAVPPAAGAHLRTGTVAVSHRARVTSEPAGPFTLGVYESDLALHLSVERGHSVVVYGYLGEPFLRVPADGDAVSTHSATAAATKLVTHGRSAVWHDVRTSSSHWRVPILVDGRREVVMGVTTTLPRPPSWPWIVLLAAIAAAALRATPAILGSVSATAAVVVAVAFMLSAYADPGTWIAGVDELFFVAAGIGVLRWGPPAARLPSALWLSLVGLAVGLSKGEMFVHALVLSALPGTAARLFATVAIAAGAAGAVAGCIAYVRSEA